MATTNIEFDRNNQTGQEIKALLNAAVKLVVDGPRMLAVLDHMKDGNGSDPTHFAEMVTQGIYPTNEDAKASYDEIASMVGKVIGDGEKTFVQTALLQCPAKHGII